MKKTIRSFLITFSAIVLVLASCQPTPRVESQGDYTLQITQIDTTAFPLVDVYISVLNAQGEPVVINTNKLQLLENGQPVNNQSIRGAGEVGPLTTILLVDNSGSMNFANKLESAKEAALVFLEQMRPGDRAGIITFNTEVRVIQEITSDQEMLTAAVEGITAQGDTAIYDALVTAVDMLNPVDGRKAVILLTDGMDNQSAATPDDALGNIGFGGLSISTVGFGEMPEGEEEADEYSGIDEDSLRFIADAAGGRYSYAADRAELTSIYDMMRRALQSEVVISYVTPMNLRDGVARALTVTLTDRYLGLGGESETQYNPGGLVPEVSQPASWLIFGIILAVLIVLLFFPVIVRMFTKKDEPAKRRKKKVKITLKD